METLKIIEDLGNNVFELENGNYFKCDGWNGEAWTDSYYCDELGYCIPHSEEYTTRPIYELDEEFEEQYNLVELELWIR